jgi:hypothetical protein
VNNRILGAIGIIGAPAMLIATFIDPEGTMPVVMGITSMIFMLGSFASHIGLWRIAATGTRWWGRVPLAVQIILVSLAFLFGVFEATGIVGEENILFTITDISWPLSMVWMLLVGIAALFARRLPMPQRLVPLICGFSFPSTMVITSVMGVALNDTASSLIFFSMLAVFWALLGLVVMQSEPVRQQQIGAQPHPA